MTNNSAQTGNAGQPSRAIPQTGGGSGTSAGGTGSGGGSGGGAGGGSSN